MTRVKHEAFVYQWTDWSNGMAYVGYHIGSPDDGYVSSSDHFNGIYDGTDRFSREILAWGTAREMEAFETAWLRAIDAAANEWYYNGWNNDLNYRYTSDAEGHDRDFIVGTLTKAGLQAAQGKSKKNYYVLYINDQLISCNPEWVSQKDDARIQRMLGMKVACTVTWRGNFAYFSPANLNEAEE